MTAASATGACWSFSAKNNSNGHARPPVFASGGPGMPSTQNAALSAMEAGLWKTFGKDDDAGRPSDTWVFTDEHPASVNDGGFGFRMVETLAGTSARGWVDYPARFHGNAGAFSYIDGHAEVHKWLMPARPGRLGLDAKTTDYSKLDDGRVANNKDIWWLAQRTSQLKNGVTPW